MHSPFSRMIEKSIEIVLGLGVIDIATCATVLGEQLIRIEVIEKLLRPAEERDLKFILNLGLTLSLVFWARKGLTTAYSIL